MKKFLCSLFLGVVIPMHASILGEPQEQSPTVIVVVGAPGQREYEQSFADWAKLWDKACQAAHAQLISIGQDGAGHTNELEELKAALDHEPKESSRELWIVLLGHGTYDGKEAKFNLRGPDLSATDLAQWVEPFHRPLAILNTASASGPFLNKLSAEGRVVVTATRSGYEQNYARFGQYFSAAISDPKADLDKDGQISILEAFLMANHQLGEFYTTEGRLATEHALIDDNGDGLGTPADWFRGTRAFKKPAQGASLDGRRAQQFVLIPSDAERKLSPAVRKRRNELELELMQLRDTKDKLAADSYYEQLQALLLELARLYQSADTLTATEQP